MTDQQNTQTALTLKEFAKSEVIMQNFADILGERGAKAYIASVLIAVAQSDTLSACTPTSIITSAMRAATLNLSVDPATGQAYLVPFDRRCTLIVGYKGLKDLALRTGKYKYLHVSHIYEGENLVENRLTGIHSLDLTVQRTSKTVVGYLLYFELFSGFVKTVYMTVEEIHAHAARYSKTYGRDKSLWKTDFDKMAKKTVLRLGLLQWGVFEPHVAATLVQIDETLEDVPDDDDTIEAEYKTTEATEQPEEPRMSEEEILASLGFAH